MADNNKKILCYNIISGKKCNYGNKCLYAHSLSEQNINDYRIKAYDMIKKTDNLDKVNLIEDGKLYETLCQLCKVCTSCEKNMCSGGYNCRNGVIDRALKICYDDLVYGNCKYIKCNFVHLTEKGLIPYLKQKNLLKQKPSYKSLLKKNLPQKEEADNNLIKHLFITKYNDSDSSDSYGSEDVEDIMEYLNNDNESSDESIFM
jgi:hypothetical protein